jgi:hypothetical protein
MSDNKITLTLTPAESQALHRALCDYRKILEFSALRESTLVGAELTQVDNIEEKLSLQFFYPIRNYPG